MVYWIGKGVKFSDTVFNLMVREGVIKGAKRKITIKQKPKKEEGAKEAPKETPKKEELKNNEENKEAQEAQEKQEKQEDKIDEKPSK